MPDNNYFARYIPLLIQVVVADLDQRRTFGRHQVSSRDAYRAHLIWLAVVDSHDVDDESEK